MTEVYRPMTSNDRRAREQAAVKDKILAAARHLFVSEGYESVSMRRIAQAIDYTAPALYTHFKDKTELMAELCRRDFGTLAEHFNKLAKVADPVERIFRIGMSYIRFATDNPNHYRLMFLSTHPADLPPEPEDLKRMNDPDQDAYAFLRHTVAEAIDAGQFLPEHKDSHLIAQVLWAGVHGVASLQITHGQDPWITWRSLERRSRTICETTLRGFLTPQASAAFNP